MRNIRRIIALFVLLVLLPWQIQALQTGDRAKIEFSGRMVALPTCQVSSDRVMAVAFGNVAINKIDSGEFIRPLLYSLTNCGTADNTVRMLFKATPGEFDTSSMSTSMAGLEVKILKDGQPLALNQFFKIADPQNPPELKMQLVQVPGVKLQESPFTAVGTLLAEYL